MMFIVLVLAVRTSQDVFSADVVLKNSVAVAVKAAAGQFDGESLRIDFHQAQKSFTRMLRENLELNGSLKPEKYSAFSGRPVYTLVVYDGQTFMKRPAGIRYVYEDGKLTETEIPGGGFPRTFTLSDGIEVTLHSPGAIAEVEISSRKVFGGETDYRRWAAARIVRSNQKWIVALQGKD
jgi:hypothetical protein